MTIADYRITRFQFARDRTIGDSQVKTDQVNVAALELISKDQLVGLGFIQSLFTPLPDESEIERIFLEEAWPSLEGKEPGMLAHRISRPRGGNIRRMSLPFEEAIQQAVWDLFAKSCGLPLWQLLGGTAKPVPAYASGLDFHLSDTDFQGLFARASELGFKAFKIKVGHPELERDIHRLNLLKRVIDPQAKIMIDANEAWSAKQTIHCIEQMRKAGHDIYWVEDPILRDDFAGLKLLRDTLGPTLVNSGEYLDAHGKRLLLDAEATDMLNVHGQITDVMRVGWLAADRGIPVTLGNTFLEVGVNLALAIPEVSWLEYSFQNFEHLVEEPYLIKDGMIHGCKAAGHGLVLSESARARYHCQQIVDRADLPAAPAQRYISQRPTRDQLLQSAR
ncbi:MAG TPA: mandelate racemase/muconate lactonizing enzyme family protein [Steroidobacteraceae bacterium]|nr:mandelate racemase/muconate lactonizing enzyme family protein [Steroidobacteraceae bacterium]